MSTVISVVNHKGGVAKTTATMHFGHAIADATGKRVLLIDFDPQASLTETCGHNPHQLPASLYDLLVDDHGVKFSPQSVVQKTNMPGVDILPSNIELAQAEQRLMGEVAREHVFKAALDQIRDDYDYILIDCPPSLGLLTTNALTASDLALVPMSTEHIALRAAQHLFPTIKTISEKLNPKLQVLGIAVSKHDARTRHGVNVLAQIQEAFEDAVFATVIPDSVRPKDAMATNRTLMQFDPRHVTTKAYLDLTDEILERLRKYEQQTMVATAGETTHG